MQANLALLLADGVIDEVLGRLKSGKEADVYLVRHRGEVVAAKVYKDRDQRNFKNNAVYKEGRQVRNSRTRRAVEKGSSFGRREAEESWKSAEADALYRLHAEGIRVPTPKMFYEGVLLMQLVTGADGEPAPRLIDAPIAIEVAGAIYRDLRRAMVGMLCCDMIHGDLSPYNVLFGAEGPIIIDFPQTMSSAHNNRAELFFRRDFDNIHRFLSGIDPSLQRARGEGHEIWRAYVRRDLGPDFVPSTTTREVRDVRPPSVQQPRGRPVTSGAAPFRSPNRVVVPEVVYLRRQGPSQNAPEERARPPATPSFQHEPAPHLAPQTPQHHPLQQHRPQHRASHPPIIPPEQRSQPVQALRRGGPPAEPAPQPEVRDSSTRKGPRRRRRGRRFD